MATAATLHSGTPTASHRMFNAVPGGATISQEVKNILELAAEAFQPESYKKAAKYFKTALDMWGDNDNKPQDQVVILTKYMLYISWLESTEAVDLMQSLRGLEDLERNYGYEYPMLYYAVGKACFKLFRFSKADEIVKKGFSVLNGDINVVEYNIPGTNTLIPESSKERLVTALVSLNDQCSSWHCPNAVCCMRDCSSYNQNESADKNIFYESPTYSGRVVVNCNNTSKNCEMTFHSSCWKAKKEQLLSLGNISIGKNKEVLNLECFTPNCENDGVPCTIKKIVVYDEHGNVKTWIEQRAEDTPWHAKSNAASKGAIRKQLQPPKVKVPSSEPRAPLPERAARAQPTSSIAPTPRNTTLRNPTPKIEEVEDEDDIDNEQALEAGIEKLKKLRASNFGIKDDAIWRPDLPMYGNEYMLATAEVTPDPDFSDQGSQEAGIKNFFFSYFYEYISERGFVKIDALNQHWAEAKDLDPNSSCILNHYLDVSEFLLQSLKFAVVGDYICVADKLPDAYELTKNNTCEIMRFFLLNDIDQRSTCSSIDDEAVFNDIVNQEKNNSLQNSLIPSDATITNKEFNNSNAYIAVESNENANGVDKITDTPNAASDSSEVPKTPIIQSSPVYENNVQQNGLTNDIAEPCETAEETEDAVSREVSPIKELEDEAPTIEFSQQPPLWVEHPEINSTIVTAKFNGTDEKEEWPSSVDAVNEVQMTDENKNLTFLPQRSNFGPVSPITPKNKMNNCDPSHAAQLIEVIHKLSIKEAEYQTKVHNLESELEHVKGVHATKRISMLQKSLQKQYTYIHNAIVMKISECRLKHDVYMAIREIVNSTGQKWPGSEPDFMKVITELEKMSTNTQLKYREYNEKLLRTKDPDMIEEFNLEPEVMPEMPQVKLNEMIRTAFGMYEVHMKELHRLSMQQQPPTMQQRSFHSPIQPPPPAPMFVASQYGLPPPEYYSGSPMVPNPALAQHLFQQNYNRSLAQNVNLTSPRNPPNSFTLPPAMNFGFPAPLPNMSAFQASTSVQQPVYTYVKQSSSEIPQQTASAQRNVLPTQGSAQPPATVNAQATITSTTSEQPKLSAPLQASSPLTLHRSSFSSFTQQNGQLSEKSIKYPSQSSFSSQPENLQTSENSSAEGAQEAKNFVAPEQAAHSPMFQFPQTPVKQNSISHVQSQSLDKSAANLPKASPSLAASKLMINSLSPETFATPNKKISTSLDQETNCDVSATKNCNRAKSVPEIPKIFKTPQRPSTPLQKYTSTRNDEQHFEWPTNSNAVKSTSQPVVASQNGAATNNNQNAFSAILQAPLLFRDTPEPAPYKDIVVRVPEDSANYDVCAKPENTTKKPGNTSVIPNVNNGSTSARPKKAEPRKNVEHSMDILMRKMRKQYKGVLELDLLKGVESVRARHNYSLSKLPMSRIIREASECIADRQKKQLCGYVNPLPRHSHAQSNSSISHLSEEERKRYSYGSSSSFGTANTSSLKKDPQHSLSSKKKWEPVMNPNDSWTRENPESECLICLDAMNTDAAYTLACKHTFHKKCIKGWYQQSQSCPSCRVHSTIDDEYPPLPLG